MNMNKSIPSLTLCCVLLAGCISTTTGSVPREANETEAAELNYQLGARYYKNGKFELARDRLLLSVKLDPNRAVTYSTLALTYEALGNLRLATQNYEKAVEVAPRNFEVRNMYAVFLCNQRNFAGAAENFEKSARHPENDNAEITLTNAGVCLVQKPDPEKAEEFFREALQVRADYGEALLQLCLLKYQAEDYLSSRAFLQRFMSANKTTAGVLYLGSQIEAKLGDERAYQDFVQRLLREFPQSPEARKAMETG
ncbi:MAG: type IV pilus biogenesis/stability protein PilW [Gammaproteobacteria bacterium]|nr:type IV pilus biogenesis/stability protein PilW [Gammaproteobacteria bacterium]